MRDLVSAMKKKGHAANLNLDFITADHLSMETLLSLTSKRAGEWFKEELRDLGGLDHLIRTLSECVSYLTADEISMWTEPLANKLKKADRVLKVLESVSSLNLGPSMRDLLPTPVSAFHATYHPHIQTIL